MSNVLAEGGYQAFDLSGTDTTVLLASLLVAVAALGVAFVMMQGVLKADDGTEDMTVISDAIHEGAMAYIKRQFRTSDGGSIGSEAAAEPLEGEGQEKVTAYKQGGSAPVGAEPGRNSAAPA